MLTWCMLLFFPWPYLFFLNLTSHFPSVIISVGSPSCIILYSFSLLLVLLIFLNLKIQYKKWLELHNKWHPYFIPINVTTSKSSSPLLEIFRGNKPICYAYTLCTKNNILMWDGLWIGSVTASKPFTNTFTREACFQNSGIEIPCRFFLFEFLKYQRRQNKFKIVPL